MSERLSRRERWRCWIAVEEGRPLGCIWLELFEKVPNPSSESEEHAYVTAFYVVAEARQTGLGGALLEEAIAECTRRGLDCAVLWSTPRVGRSIGDTDSRPTARSSSCGARTRRTTRMTSARPIVWWLTAVIISCGILVWLGLSLFGFTMIFQGEGNYSSSRQLLMVFMDAFLALGCWAMVASLSVLRRPPKRRHLPVTILAIVSAQLAVLLTALSLAHFVRFRRSLDQLDLASVACRHGTGGAVRLLPLDRRDGDCRRSCGRGPRACAPSRPRPNRGAHCGGSVAAALTHSSVSRGGPP